jgi:putative intracellular protease/amidase
VKSVGTLLFPGFELLDVFGPLEMFGTLPESYHLEMVAETVGGIASGQGPRAHADVSLADAKP